MLRAALLASTLSIAFLGCRTNPVPTDEPVTAATTTSALPSAQTPVSTPPSPSLPKLKPILKKPFPEGSSEEVVCEAIDNTQEKDLWARFGHMVPAYMPGAIYVLDAGPESSAKLRDFIQKDYARPHYPEMATCRGTKTLLYLSNMMEESSVDGKPYGRLHLSGELEKRFKIKTSETYAFDPRDGRLAAYCRADADECDDLLNLNPSLHGKGLCNTAVARCHVSKSDDRYAALLEICRGLPRRDISCVKYAFSGPENTECSQRISKLVCASAHAK